MKIIKDQGPVMRDGNSGKHQTVRWATYISMSLE